MWYMHANHVIRACESCDTLMWVIKWQVCATVHFYSDSPPSRSVWPIARKRNHRSLFPRHTIATALASIHLPRRAAVDAIIYCAFLKMHNFWRTSITSLAVPQMMSLSHQPTNYRDTIIILVLVSEGRMSPPRDTLYPMHPPPPFSVTARAFATKNRPHQNHEQNRVHITAVITRS